MTKTVLLYTPKTTPRVNYIFRQIFVRILNIPIEITTDIEKFESYTGAKFSYGKTPVANELFVQSYGLLYEQGINELIEISVGKWNNTPCFFNVGIKSHIPYDIFSASFYLLSRYEEYLPLVLNKHNCFEATESLAYKNNFLEIPVVDIWANEFLNILSQKFPNLEINPRKYEYITTVNVSHTYLYKSKGLIRSLVGMIYDLGRLKIYNVCTRLKVALNISKDPYDTYDQIISDFKNKQVKTIFFFLVSDFTSFDINILFTKNSYKLLMKSVSDYVKVGLLGSYYTFLDNSKLEKESNRLHKIINIPCNLTRINYTRVKFPNSYQDMIDLDIHEDYSMGYYNKLGFRASTSIPFYFYDLNFEIQTPLKAYPYAFSDVIFKNELQTTPNTAIDKVKILADVVKKTNGTFISVFHNESLSNYDEWHNWHKLYRATIRIAQPNIEDTF